MDPPRRAFDHERFDVYRVTLDFVSLAREVATALPRGHSSLADQLVRAAGSIALNIAEGAGEFSRREKARFYRIALRSATECSAILDVGHRLAVVSRERERRGKEMLARIAAMLTALTTSLEDK